MADPKKVRFLPGNENQRLKIQMPSEIDQKNKRKAYLNPLEELIQCTFCMDKMTDPKMLSCQHSFCLSCLQSHLPVDACGIECPICKQETPLEKGLESLQLLPGNMYIDSILKMLSGGNSPRTPTKLGPETRCVKCQKLCQFLERACQHCKQVFCGVCWSLHMSELQEALKQLLDHLKESQTRLDHRIDAFQDRCLQLEDNIRTATERKVNQLKQCEKKCLDEAAKIKQDGLKSSEELRSRIQDTEKNIEGHAFEKITDDSQKVARFMSLHHSTEGLLQELSRWGDTRTIFDAESFKIDYDAEASPDAEADDDDTTVSSTENVQNPLDCPDSLVLHYKTRSFAPKLTWNKCLRPTGVGIAPWNPNCIYVAGADTRQIYGIDKQKGKLLFRISSPNLLCPSGLAFSRQKEQIFISDKWKHCIHIFSRNGEYIKAIGRKGTQNGQFSSPEGIAINSTGYLFICDTGNDRVQVFNPEGKFMYTFGITGIGATLTSTGFLMDYKCAELNIPTGIAVTQDKIIVADSGNRRVKIYGMDGKKVGEFGSLGKNRGQFRSPEIVAVDPLGFILVGDSGNARVQIFRPNGTLVRAFRNKGKWAWISGICVTPQLEIVVTDYKNHSVTVF